MKDYIGYFLFISCFCFISFWIIGKICPFVFQDLPTITSWALGQGAGNCICKYVIERKKKNDTRNNLS